MSGTGFEYDSNGNVVAYTYDGAIRLTASSYPDRGTRRSKTTYAYGSYIDEVLMVCRPNALLEKDKRIFYSTNDLYSVYALTDSDGDVVERYVYDPYGKVTVLDGNGTPRTVNESAYGNPWTWEGRRLDSETGLMYFRQRMYSPDLGRFVSRYTKKPKLDHSWYQFQFGQPSRLLDPYGDPDAEFEVVGEPTDPPNPNMPEQERKDRELAQSLGLQHVDIFYNGQIAYGGFGAKGNNYAKGKKHQLNRKNTGEIMWGKGKGMPCSCAGDMVILACLKNRPVNPSGRKYDGIENSCHQDVEGAQEDCCLGGWTGPVTFMKKKALEGIKGGVHDPHGGNMNF
jgi:RHS repeat-associated protein